MIDQHLYGDEALRIVTARRRRPECNESDSAECGPQAGVLTTASGLTFTGDVAGNALALRTRDGATLWHATFGRMNNAQSLTNWTGANTS